MAHFQAVCGDDSFGPVVKTQSCRNGFDFTVLFEESILSIGPATLFLLLVPLRVYHLHPKQLKVNQTSLYALKIGVITIYAALQLTLLILGSHSVSGSPIFISSATLNLISALGLGLLSHLEHRKSVKPSLLIALYLLTSLAFDVVRARTQWLLKDNNTIAAVLATAAAVKTVILVLEDLDKRRYLLSIYHSFSPESTSGVFSRSLFWWLTPLLREGSRKILSADDLFPINKDLASVNLSEQLHTSWTKYQNGKRALVWIVARCFCWPLAVIIVPRLFVVGLKLSQPFLIEKAIAYIDAPVGTESEDIGYGLIGAYACVYIGIAIFTGWYQHLTFRLVTMVRGGLIAMIYVKMMDLKVGNVSESSAMTLMGTDVERIVETWPFVGEVWADVIQVAVAIWMLEARLGVVCIVPVAIAIVASLASLQTATFTTIRQKIWLEAIQKRVNTTSEVLGSMKNVKMLGLAEKFSAVIQNMRVKELDFSKRYRRLSVTNTCLGNVPLVITPVLTFAAFSIRATARNDESLSISRAFGSLSILSLLSYPIAGLIFAIPQIYAAIGCFKRIEDFLLEDSRVDHRLLVSKVDQTQDLDAARSQSFSLNEGVELQAYPTATQQVHNEDTQNQEAVIIRNGSFGWSQDGPVILQEIELNIPQSALTIVVGSVGCGKSTLAKAILGETLSSEGFVYVRSPETAFCDQTPWIKSGTVREIIVGESSFEEAWYNSVIRACALIPDISRMTSGDQTEVGSNGIMLSGGQKQRLAIARSVYARKKLAIFDDVLSGLDSVTEEIVFERVFGWQGLLRRTATTTILITHGVNRLPMADHIIVLGQDGRVLEQGTYTHLSKSKSYVQGLELRTRDENNSTFEENDCSSLSSTSQAQTPQSSAVAPSQNRQSGDLTIYRYYIVSMGWLSLGIFLSFITMNAVFSALQYLWLNWWSSANPISSNPRLAFWLGIYALFALLQSLAIIFAVAYFFITIVPKSAQNLHWALLKVAMVAPMSFFAATETGFLVNRFSEDMRLIDMTLPAALVNTCFQFAGCISGAVLTVVAVKYMAVALPIIVGLLYLIQKFYLRTSRQLRLLEIETKAPLFSHFIESLSGLVTIRAFGWSEASRKKNIELLDASQKPFYLLLCVQRWLSLVLDMIVAGLAIVLMALAVNLRSSIGAGFLGIALVNIMNLGQSLTDLVKFWTLLETSLGAIARVKSFAKETPAETLHGENQVPHEEWPMHGRLTFENVSASHNSHSADVLSNITFSIEGGQKIGISGRSGSGKSSLISTLFRMTEITTGKITIDGLDIAVLPRPIIRSRLISLSQDPFLFIGSVRFNADPLGNVSDSKIIECLEKVQLWSIVLAKGGLDVNMDSNFLSHGQRQLFCLARAMLREGTILVLDEPTSSVDAETDLLMQRLIRNEFKHHIVIMIAHRLGSLMDFDKIVVLENGRLVEFESPGELLTRPSIFLTLYNAAQVGRS